ncbi:MAG: flagellar motor switch protein FliN [Gammaproteobacteria bacterium]
MNDTTDTEQAGESTDDWAAAMAEQAEGEQQAGAQGADNPAAPASPQLAESEAYQTAQFDDLQPDAHSGSAEDVNLDVILDIPVNLSMEIGRTRVPIRNLLQLNQGSVVELDRLAGEPMDVLVNGTLIAHGEVVVVNEKFGIRLTDVVSPAERVKKLK